MRRPAGLAEIDQVMPATWGNSANRTGRRSPSCTRLPISSRTDHRSAGPARRCAMQRKCSATTPTPRHGPHAVASSGPAMFLPTRSSRRGASRLSCRFLLANRRFHYCRSARSLASFAVAQGPNVLGPLGYCPPIARRAEALMKETVVPSGANRHVFVAAPIVTFTLALVAWAGDPFDYGVVVVDTSMSGSSICFAISSLSVYGHHHGGSASNFALRLSRALRSRADGVLRGGDRLCPGDRAAVRRFLEPDRDRPGAAPYLVRGPLLPMFVISSSPASPRPTGRRSICRKASRSWWPAISSSIRR